MSDTKIERLTSEQKARLPEFVEKWRAITMATGPADRPRAGRAVRLAYEVAGLKPPRILWTPSPLAAGLVQIALMDRRFGASVGKAMDDALKPVLNGLDWDAAIPADTDMDRALLSDAVRAVAEAATGTAYGSVAAAMVKAMVRPAIGAPVKDTIVSTVHSQATTGITAAVDYPVMNEVRRAIESEISVAFRTEMESAMTGRFVTACKEANVTDDDLRMDSHVSITARWAEPDRILSTGSLSLDRNRNWMAAGSAAMTLSPIISASAMSMRMRTPGEAAAERLIDRFGYGQHDASLLALYDYFDQVCDLPAGEKALALIELAQAAGWWMPYENICWVSGRPDVLLLDARGRLHNEDGAALSYSDGFSIYAVHGTRIPEHVIERPGEITAEDIQNEGNAEVRRVMLNKYGEGRYLEDIGAEAVHSDEYGQLFRVHLWNDEDLVMVRVIDPSTQQPYFLRVDPLAYAGRAGREARAAVASTWRYQDAAHTLVFQRPEDYVLTVES